MWIGVHSYTWLGPDTAFVTKLEGEYKYRRELAGALIKEIAMEAKEKGMQVVLVNIPYIPEVYDEVWASSLGRMPDKYDRGIAGKRLKEICDRAGIYYVDVTPRFIEEARKRWLHYPIDRHLTAEGHRIIAETVANFLKENKLLANEHKHKDK
jgi:lysophospholipase L1-like esterase